MTADRDALRDLVSAVDRWVGTDKHDPTGQARAAAARARRHLDRTDYALPGSVHDTARAQSLLRRLGLHANAATTPILVEAFAAVREEGRLRGVYPFRALFAGGPDTACRTTYPHDGAGGTIECVEVPLDDVRAAFVEAGDEPS